MTTSINVSLILLYIVQLVRLKYSSIEKRNKLTLYIYKSLLYNLIATLVRSVTQLILSSSGLNVSQLSMYALNSTSCFFFVTAVIL